MSFVTGSKRTLVSVPAPVHKQSQKVLFSR